jgi:hypothetical protein
MHRSGEHLEEILVLLLCISTARCMKNALLHALITRAPANVP